MISLVSAFCKNANGLSVRGSAVNRAEQDCGVYRGGLAGFRPLSQRLAGLVLPHGFSEVRDEGTRLRPNGTLLLRIGIS